MPDPGAIVAQLEAEQFAQELDAEQGYSAWKNHIGKPEDAVVHVRVTTFEGGTSGSGQTTREGSGIVVRCDGFVLLPEALFGDDRALQKTAKVALTFRAADGDTPSTPLSPVAPPRYHSAKTDYVLVKVNDHHFKGLHLLDVRNLQIQMPVTVVWAAATVDDPKAAQGRSAATVKSNGKPGLPSAQMRKATVGERARESGNSVPRFGLVLVDADGERPPLGAAVIEPASGGVLGIVTMSDAARGVLFSPFGYFQYVSNDVGLKVSIEDIIQPTTNARGTVTDTGQMLTMIRVPGGPTRLKGELANTYRAFYGTDVVCMPDFYIDGHPVTVGAYRDWLGQGGPRQPLGWVDNNELRTRQRNPDLPVSGLIADDALRFAAGHKKRLATPVEWARAGIGAKTQWITKLIDEWQYITKQQNDIARAKVDAYNKEIEKLSKDQNGRYIPNFKPPVGIASPNAALDQLSAQQQQLYYLYWQIKGRWFPYQHCPVGFYKEDESKWSVGEVISSVPEMCQPNYAARVYEPAYKPFSTRVDPYFSQSNAFYWLANCEPGDMDGNFADFCVAVPPPSVSRPQRGTPVMPGGISGSAKEMPPEQPFHRPYVYFKDGLYLSSDMNVLPRSGFGFRCAL